MKKVIILFVMMSFVFNGIAQTRNNGTRKTPARRTTVQKKVIPAQQHCEVSGIISYFHNNFLGIRPDIGATIRFVKTEDLDSTKFNHVAYSYYKWNKSAAAAYWEFYSKYGQAEADAAIGKLYDFEKANWDNYDAICDTLASAQLQLAIIYDETDKKYHYETVADGTGAYKISIPYGDYYAIVTSKNRKGIFMPEMMGRFEITKIKLDKPNRLHNVEFDKE